MIKLSKLISSLSPSATLAMSQKSADLKAKGVDVLNLSLGEPDFNTPDPVKKAAEKAIEDNFSFYTPVPGYLSLREKICDKLKRENGLDYQPSQIVCTTGAKQAIANSLMAIISPGEEVIIPAPYWVSYPQMVKIASGESVIIPTSPEKNFKITGDDLEKYITPKTKALILCSPSNPSGAVYNKEELEDLAKVLRKHPEIVVISDEIYEHIRYTEEHYSIATLEGMKERTIIINGVSKCYAMTGWRLGWLAAPQEVASACSKLQGQYTSNASSITQKAAEAAYELSPNYVQEMLEIFRKRRDLCWELLKEIDGFELEKPHGAFYLFPDVSGLFGKKTPKGDEIKTGGDLAMYLLEEAHVTGVGGDAFGMPQCIRFSYATNEEVLREAMSRVKDAVSKLK